MNPTSEDDASMSFMDALTASGAKPDILHTSEQITKYIDQVDKTLRQERVNFDLRRSALAKAVVAVETSLYDRQVLEKELLTWANAHAPPPPPHSTNSSSSSSEASSDDDFDLQLVVGTTEDDDDFVLINTDDRGVGDAEKKISSSATNSKTKKKKNKNKNKKSKRSQKNGWDNDDDGDDDASSPLVDPDDVGPMYRLLHEKEQQVNKATNTLSSFSKRTIAMYRAFLKIYTAEAGSSAVAVKIFEAETLRQLHMMETAQDKSLTEQQQAVSQTREKQIDVNSLRDQVRHLRENFAKAQKAKLQHEDVIRDQSNRIDVLELAARELTKTVHQLRGEIRTFEETEARRVAAMKAARNNAAAAGGGGGGGGGVGGEAGMMGEDAFTMLQSRRFSLAPSDGSLLWNNNDEDGTDGNDGTATTDGDGAESTFLAMRRQQRQATKNVHRRCKMICRVMAVSLQKTRDELRRIKSRYMNDEEPPPRPLGSGSSPASSFRRFKSISMFAETEDAATQWDIRDAPELIFSGMWDTSTQTDVKSPFLSGDEKSGNKKGLLFQPTVPRGPAFGQQGGRNQQQRRNNAQQSAENNDNDDDAAADKSKNNKKKKKSVHVAGVTSEDDLHVVDADAEFFDTLADVFTEDAKSIFRPKILRRFSQILDTYLGVGSSSSSSGNNNSRVGISIPLRKAILRCRDWALREKVSQVQHAARSEIAASLAMVRGGSSTPPRSTTNVNDDDADVDHQASTARRHSPNNMSGVYVARKPPAPSNSMRVSESAVYSDLLPNAQADSTTMMFSAPACGDQHHHQNLRRRPQTALSSSAAAASTKRGSGSGNSLALHPGIDHRFLSQYEEAGAKSRSQFPHNPERDSPRFSRTNIGGGSTSARAVVDPKLKVVEGSKAAVTHSRFV